MNDDVVFVNSVENDRAIQDLIYIFHTKCFINEKGYLTKLIDKLHELGYYKDNESFFIRPKG